MNSTPRSEIEDSSPPRLAYYYFTGLYALSESVKRVRSERFNTEVIQLTNWGFHIPLFIAQYQNSSKEANTAVRKKCIRWLVSKLT